MLGGAVELYPIPWVLISKGVSVPQNGCGQVNSALYNTKGPLMLWYRIQRTPHLKRRSNGKEVGVWFIWIPPATFKTFLSAGRLQFSAICSGTLLCEAQVSCKLTVKPQREFYQDEGSVSFPSQDPPTPASCISQSSREGRLRAPMCCFTFRNMHHLMVSVFSS